MLWALYLRSLSPAFPPDDSPETIAAALSLGIQHPPGYPLPTLLGRMAVVALALGSPAWRVNLLSALLAVLACGLAAVLAWRTLPGRARVAGSVLALGALGTLPAFWQQATEAKGGIYLLNLALGLGLWHAAIGAQGGSRRAWRAALLLTGLLLAGHYMSAALWLLPLGLWLGWGLAQRRFQAAWADLGLLLPGLALYLYLPLRAARDPWLDLGHPSTWAQFKWMLLRHGYTQGGLGPAKGIVLEQLGLLGSAMLHAGAWCLAPLALLGALSLWRRQRPLAAALLGALLLTVFAAAVVNKTPADNRWLVLIFGLPALALLPLFGAHGLGALGERARLHGAFWLLPALLLAAAAGYQAWPSQSRRGDYAAWDYANDLALCLPRGALYVAEGDYHVLPVYYLQASGRRRDVLMVLAALAGRAWYQDRLLQLDAGLLIPPGPDDRAAARGLVLAEAPRRPVVLGPYAGALDAASLAPLTLRQRGLLREAAPRFDDAPPDLFAAVTGRRPPRPVAALEPVERALLPWYTVGLVQAGNEALAGHRLAEALQQYSRALGRPGDKPEAAIQVNMARTWEAAGSPRAARLSYEAALAAQPGFEAAQAGIEALQAKARGPVTQILAQADRLAALGGQDDEALKLYDQALQRGFQSANLWRNIGVIFLRNGDKAQARRAFERALKLRPGDETVKAYLAAAMGL